MSATCGVCNVDISSSKTTEITTCSGNCKRSFHIACIKDDTEEKKLRSVKQWRCKDCRDNGSVGSGSSTPVTREFMLKVMESFKNAIFSELKIVKDEVADVTKSIRFLSDKVDASNLLIDELKKDIKALKKENDSIRETSKTLCNTVSDLQDRIGSLEQYTRRSSIEISGVPATPNEVVTNLVKDIGAVIGIDVEESQINAAHRVPSFRNDRAPSLVVQFNSRSVRDHWIKQCKVNKETATADRVNASFPKYKVYINEHLVPVNKVFLAKLKKKCRDVGIKYVWCREGKFFTRRADGEKCKRIDSDIERLKYNVLMRKDGTLPKVGDIVKLPKLAQTLRLIANSPRRAEELYNGALTDAFIQDIEGNGGIITREDLLNYQVRWEDPIKAELSGGKTLYTVPTPGSGPLMAFMLQTLDGFLEKGGLDQQNIHRIVETFKHAYGRRSELGDPYFTNITQLLNDLGSPEYIQRIRESIHDGETSTNYSYYGAKYNLTEDHGTANLVVLSPNGDAVSVTSTVNLVFGSKFVSRSTGILLNNEMDDFSDSNITNFFGIPPSPANYIRPGKRPMSSMCPSVIVNQDGSVRLVVGSAGGTKITTSTVMVAMLNLWFNRTIKEAIDEPRIHHQLFPMQVSYEYGTTKDILKGLKKIGHKTTREPRGSGVTGIAVTDGKIYANCDKSKYGNHHGF